MFNLDEKDEVLFMAGGKRAENVLFLTSGFAAFIQLPNSNNKINNFFLFCFLIKGCTIDKIRVNPYIVFGLYIGTSTKSFYTIAHFIKPVPIQCICKLDFGKVFETDCIKKNITIVMLNLILIIIKD